MMGPTIEEQNIAEMEGSRQRAPIDELAERFGGSTRRDRRAFKSRLKRLVRKEARKSKRGQS